MYSCINLLIYQTTVNQGCHLLNQSNYSFCSIHTYINVVVHVFNLFLKYMSVTLPMLQTTGWGQGSLCTACFCHLLFPENSLGSWSDNRGLCAMDPSHHFDFHLALVWIVFLFSGSCSPRACSGPRGNTWKFVQFLERSSKANSNLTPLSYPLNRTRSHRQSQGIAYGWNRRTNLR